MLNDLKRDNCITAKALQLVSFVDVHCRLLMLWRSFFKEFEALKQRGRCKFRSNEYSAQLLHARRSTHRALPSRVRTAACRSSPPWVMGCPSASRATTNAETRAPAATLLTSHTEKSKI